MAEPLSLYELNNLIKLALKECFPDQFWVRAELSEVRSTGAGHCYVEFVEKDSRTGAIIAKMRGNIWANTFRMLKPYFEEETGQSFVSGLKVLVNVTVDFHEVYGPSLTIVDIDPTFTVGDMMKQRLEIIRKLKEEEIYDQNKELTIPLLPQKIAVVSSATAAGFGDFMNQLSGGYVFYCKLFPAIMQGEQAESSILKALNRIEKLKELFDVVVIVRGGGAVSDLTCFDSYALARRCATFSLPIITGIGHERDESVLDMIANTRMKTPTAAAEFLISCFEEAEKKLNEMYSAVVLETKEQIVNESNRIRSIAFQLSQNSRLAINNQSVAVEKSIHTLKYAVENRLMKERNRLKEARYLIDLSAKQRVAKETSKMALYEQVVRFSSPEAMLRKGFTLTTKDGKIVRSKNELKIGDNIVTYFADGTKESIVSKSKN